MFSRGVCGLRKRPQIRFQGHFGLLDLHRPSIHGIFQDIRTKYMTGRGNWLQLCLLRGFYLFMLMFAMSSRENWLQLCLLRGFFLFMLMFTMRNLHAAMSQDHTCVAILFIPPFLVADFIYLAVMELPFQIIVLFILILSLTRYWMEITFLQRSVKCPAG